MELWTLGELAERVEAALADSPGPVNGRVRAVPDQRAIRWYTTTGLIDRPAQMRGRTALYSRRHLLQLIAIKRRQSQGHTLAEIQSELTGAPNQTLEPIAALPADLTNSPPTDLDDEPTPDRSHFWTTRPPTPAQPASAGRGDQQQAAGVAPTPTESAPAESARDERPVGHRAAGPAPAVASASAQPASAVVGGVDGVGFVVRVGDGVLLVVEGVSGVGVDVGRVVGAAGPLVAELRRQGLLVSMSGDES